jgi:hypothetical protein
MACAPSALPPARALGLRRRRRTGSAWSCRSRPALSSRAPRWPLGNPDRDRDARTATHFSCAPPRGRNCPIVRTHSMLGSL